LRKLLRLFRFTGRANRAEYWTVTVGGWFAAMTLYAMAATLSPRAKAASWIVVLAVPVVVALIATSARRLHDRGKSAWWLLLFTVAPAVLSVFATVVESQGGGAVATTRLPSLILSIWGWAEMGFLPTRRTAERFGEPANFRGLAKVFD
jgi:uncharacterized membrane protein YhaH (DUF805 family)